MLSKNFIFLINLYNKYSYSPEILDEDKLQNKYIIQKNLLDKIIETGKIENQDVEKFIVEKNIIINKLKTFGIIFNQE